MREDVEVREAKSLKREYDFHMKYANRPNAPKIETDYYTNMANNTARFINWRLLEPKKKVIIEENY